MNIIVAVDSNWAIGNQGGLLVKIPRDQKLFQEMTMGKVVVMGRKTLESLPQKQPLQGRTNIVMTTVRDYSVRGAVVVHSLEELLGELAKYQKEDIFVIGGGTVYRQMLPYCDTVHVTKIDYSYDADVYFPNLDELEEWKLTADSEEQTYFDLEYYFLRYEKKK